MASLCHLHQQLHNPQAKVRVFIIGGSFTEGRSTTGCCCNPLIDARCPSNNECYNTNEPIDGSRTCRWSNFLAMLLLDKYKAEIIVLNLASSAISSDKSLAENAKHLQNLTSNDLVFIDHSVNDGYYFHRPGFDKLLLSGIEHIIRFIHQSSTSPPSIILLAMWPFPHGGYIPRARYDKLASSRADYSSVYKQVAAYYSIPLWSYKDFVWSPGAEQTLTPLLDEIKFSPERYAFLHPSWHIHLLYADILSAALLRHFSSCPTVTNTSPPPPRELPLALTEFNVNLCVNDPAAKLLSLSFTQQPTQDLLARHNITAAYGTWRHTFDSPGRYGLISELGISEKAEKQLIIPIPNPGQVMDKASHLISIKYLRSYVNGGMFDVYLCGAFIAGFDAIWRDFKTYKVSSIEAAEIIYNPFGDGRRRYCADRDTPTVEIRHYRMNDRKYKARGPTQKVKIVAVDVCKIDTSLDNREEEPM